MNKPLLIGQLKAIADPFYTHLHAAAPTLLDAERTANGTKAVSRTRIQKR